MKTQIFIFSLVFPPKNYRKKKKVRLAIVCWCSTQLISIDLEMPLDPSIAASMYPRASRSRHSTIIIASNVIFPLSFFLPLYLVPAYAHTHKHARALTHTTVRSPSLSPQTKFTLVCGRVVCVCAPYAHTERKINADACILRVAQCLNMYLFQNASRRYTVGVVVGVIENAPRDFFFFFTARAHIERFYET